MSEAPHNTYQDLKKLPLTTAAPDNSASTNLIAKNMLTGGLALAATYDEAKSLLRDILMVPIRECMLKSRQQRF